MSEITLLSAILTNDGRVRASFGAPQTADLQGGTDVGTDDSLLTEFVPTRINAAVAEVSIVLYNTAQIRIMFNERLDVVLSKSVVAAIVRFAERELHKKIWRNCLSLHPKSSIHNTKHCDMPNMNYFAWEVWEDKVELLC